MAERLMAGRVTAGHKYRPLRGLFATMRNAFAEATANRRGLVFALAVMILNDAVWVAFWVVFFHRVGTVRGWDTDGVMLLLAVLTTSAGFSLGLLANARWVGSIVTGGQLDATLSLPVPMLGHVLVRRVEPTLGDFVFGIGLFAIHRTAHAEADRGVRLRRARIGCADDELPRAHRLAGLLRRAK